jgi:uncharacterized protein
VFSGCATAETGAAVRLGGSTGVRTITDLATNLLLSAAVFAGAFVSGLAGFAFSAVAGAILLRIFQPLEAVPLMMACSIGVQAANLCALRRNIQWGGSALLIAGGALGIPIAIHLLQNTDTYVLRLGFGLIVSLYAGCMLFRPALTRVGGTASRHLIALIGFGGGLIGGLTAMPGAIPTIWCDMRGMPKSDQRGLVQPFIAIMQVFALAVLLEHHGLSSKIVIDLAISLPALFAGTLLGILAFRNINEVGFRRTILVVLLFSGASLAFA